MYRGKSTCKVLKEVRRKVAQANDIPLEERECTHKGDCAGTCPYCEAEVRYLERELAKHKSLGKAVAVAGIALSAVMTVVAQTPTPTTLPDSLTSAEMNTSCLGGVDNYIVVDNNTIGEVIRVPAWKTPRRPEWRFPSEYGSLKTYVKNEINKNPELRQWIDAQLQSVKRKGVLSNNQKEKSSRKSDNCWYEWLDQHTDPNKITLFLNTDGQVTGAFVFEYLHNPTDDDLIMMDELSKIFTNMPRWLHNDKDYPSHFNYESHVVFPHNLLR